MEHLSISENSDYASFALQDLQNKIKTMPKTTISLVNSFTPESLYLCSKNELNLV